MKKLLFLAVLTSSISVFAGNGQCALCEINRENNKKNPAPPVYYEDYLKGGGAAAPAAAPAASTTPAAKPAAPATTPAPATNSTTWSGVPITTFGSSGLRCLAFKYCCQVGSTTNRSPSMRLRRQNRATRLGTRKQTAGRSACRHTRSPEQTRRRTRATTRRPRLQFRKEFPP